MLYSATFTSFYEYSSANNPTRQAYKQQGSTDQTVIAAYTYNGENLPLTVTTIVAGQPAYHLNIYV